LVGFAEMLLFSGVMGFSIFLSLPLVLWRGTDARKAGLLTAVAVGILVFLVADVFADAAPTLYSGGSYYGYGSSPYYDAAFLASLAAGFLAIYLFDGRSRAALSPAKLSLMIALGIGFQNLTEGLVFGSLGVAIGLTGATLVVLVGFTLQNLTEGFPIASPFLHGVKAEAKVLFPLFFIGGVPTLMGAAVGFYYNSAVFELVFEGVAIGSILYVILPMLSHLFKSLGDGDRRLVYAGVFVGFLLGSLVNLV
jgi:ZIP family zinc transporter